jgi:phospholipid transport system substrate-binding protein
MRLVTNNTSLLCLAPRSHLRSPAGLWLMVTALSLLGVIESKLAVADMEPAVVAPKTAEALVEQASDELLVLIEESRAYVKDDPDRFFTAVEAMLRPVVDFKGFARSVMAAHYKGANIDQRERFADAFKWSLVRSYALALTEFSDGEIVLIPADRPPRSPRRQNVKMEIRLGSGEVYPVVYSMALGKDQVWRMRNIIINGVNIGLTYRSQFASAVQDPRYDGELDAVIDGWGSLLAGETQQQADASSSVNESPVNESAVGEDS